MSLEEVRVHRARAHRVAPAALAAHAWAERDKRPPAAGADETRGLLAGPEGGRPPPRRPAPACAGKGDFLKDKKRLYDILRPPYFIISLIILFVCMEAWADERVRAALEYAPAAARRREAWRLLTYCALHAGPQHLALNCLVALAVGWVLEREQGGARVAALWAGGVAAGALGACALQPAVRVVGASAGVYALLTAHLANVALGYGHMKLCWFRVLAVCVLGASDCAWLVTRAATPPLPVAWAAHALGAAAGLPLALLFFTGENRRCRWVRAARAAAAVLLALGAAAAVLCNVYRHPDTER